MRTISDISGSLAFPHQFFAKIALLVLAGTVGVACNFDRAPRSGWRFSGDSPTTDPGGSDDVGTNRDVTQGDGTTGDSSPVSDSNSDTGRARTVTGWYRGAFETSLFAPTARASIRGGKSKGNPCSISIEETGERWWYEGQPSGKVLRVFDRDHRTNRRIAKLRASGTVTDKGEYGHLGAYDRRFDPDSSRVLACDTSKQLARCVVPRSSDRCVHDLNGESPVRYELAPGLQTDGPHSMTTYNLRLTWREGDEVTRRLVVSFKIPWTMSTDSETPWYYQSIGESPSGMDVSLYDPDHAKSSVRYDNVRGWIRVLEQPADDDPAPMRIYLKATDSNVPSLRVWGSFERGKHGW